MSDAERELTEQANQLGYPAHHLHAALYRSLHIVTRPGLTDEAKARQIVQRFLALGWTPPGGDA